MRFLLPSAQVWHDSPLIGSSARWRESTSISFAGHQPWYSSSGVYFALPLLGISLDAMTAGILVLGLNAGAYGSEVVRGAIKSVPREQVEAAIALNLSERQTLWRIVLPQAILTMIPPFGNLLIELLKGTALVSLITLSELTFRGQMLRTAMLRSGEIFGLILLLYFLLSLIITFGMRRLEQRLAIGQDYGGVK